MEAGAVLGDIVGPAAAVPGLGGQPGGASPVGECITVLQDQSPLPTARLRSWPNAVRAGDEDAVLAALADAHRAVASAAPRGSVQ